MPLEDLRLGGTPVTDLSALAQASSLRQLVLPANAMNIDFLRTFPKLERLSFTETNFVPDMTAAEFWQKYDAKDKSSTHQQ
jgi:hypothetical protein